MTVRWLDIMLSLLWNLSPRHLIIHTIPLRIYEPLTRLTMIHWLDFILINHPYWTNTVAETNIDSATNVIGFRNCLTQQSHSRTSEGRAKPTGPRSCTSSAWWLEMGCTLVSLVSLARWNAVRISVSRIIYIYIYATPLKSLPFVLFVVTPDVFHVHCKLLGGVPYIYIYLYMYT